MLTENYILNPECLLLNYAVFDKTSVMKQCSIKRRSMKLPVPGTGHYRVDFS